MSYPNAYINFSKKTCEGIPAGLTTPHLCLAHSVVMRASLLQCFEAATVVAIMIAAPLVWCMCYISSTASSQGPEAAWVSCGSHWLSRCIEQCSQVHICLCLVLREDISHPLPSGAHEPLLVHETIHCTPRHPCLRSSPVVFSNSMPCKHQTHRPLSRSMQERHCFQ